MKQPLIFWICILICNNVFTQNKIHLESDALNKRVFEKANIPKVKGQLLHFDAERDKDLVIDYVPILPIQNSRIYKIVKINPDGTFFLELELGLPYQQIWLRIGEYYYGQITVNSDLEIIANLKRLKKKSVRMYGKGISFKGTDGALNKYVNEYNIFEQKRKSKASGKSQMAMMNMEMSPSDKVQAMEVALKEMEKIELEYVKKKSDKYHWFLKNERISEFYGNLFVAHWGKEMDKALLEKTVLHQPISISNASTSYYGYMATYFKLPSSEERLTIWKSIYSDLLEKEDERQAANLFLTEYAKRMKREEYSKDLFDSGKDKYFDAFKEEFIERDMVFRLEKLSQLPANKGNLIKLMGEPKDINNSESYFAKIYPTVKEGWIKKLIKREWEDRQKKLAEITRVLQNGKNITEETKLGIGQLELSFGANLYESNHETVEDLINSIRSTYKGKAVIIDVWATWCGPCISDMKNSKEIKKELRKLPLDIVYLCVENGNSNMDKWKKKVTELGVEGNHIFVPKKLTNELMTFFNLGGFPSYIFIDKEGNHDTKLINFISKLDIETVKAKL